MFNFLNIGILFGLVGVGIPLLIHLFAKRKYKKIYFSSIRFLKLLQAQELRRLNLKQMFLLILRSLIIFFLVLGFSRPVIKKSAITGGSKSSSAMALIIDNSLSIKRPGLFQEIKKNVRAVIDLKETNDNLCIIPAVDFSTEEPQFFHDSDRLKRQVEDIQVSCGRRRIFRKIKQAVELLKKQKQLNKEIYLFTDLQSTEFNTVTDSVQPDLERISLFILPVHGNIMNIAVKNCGLNDQIIQSGSFIQIYADIINYSKREVKDMLVRLNFDEKSLDQRLITLKAGQQRRVDFLIRPESDGWHRGKIIIDDGSFPYDDNRYFVCHIPEKRNIFLIGNSLKDILPVKIAIEAQDSDRSSCDIEEYYFGDGWINSLDRVDVVVFSNYPEFSPDEVDHLEKFLRTGRGIFFIMGSDINIRKLNQYFFQPVLNMPLGNVINDSEIVKSYGSFMNIDYRHPIFKNIFEEHKNKFYSPEIYKSIEILGNNFTSIIDAGTGKYFLVEQSIYKGKVICMCTSLQEDWSDLIYKTIFAPLMVRSIEYLSGVQTGENENAFIGDEISISEIFKTVKGKFYLKKPDKQEILLFPKLNSGKIFLEYINTDQDGIYGFYHGTELLGLRAVNIIPAESDLNEISKKEVEEIFPNLKVNFLKNINSLKKTVLKSRYGIELWWKMIFTAFIILIIEMIVSKGKFKIGWQSRKHEKKVL